MSIKNLFLWSPVIIFLGISGVALFGPYGLFGYNEARLKMINLAAADLTEIKVVLYKEPCEVKRLVSGDSSVCSFQIKADSHYRITWKELNTGIYREEVGYVTHGFDFKHELQFLGNGKVNFKIDGSI
jgi:hypothetical protein